MSQDKLEGQNQEQQSNFGPDVYESAAKLNYQVAIKAPAVLLAVGKITEQITNSHLVTGVCSMVIGGISFFGNRYYRNKGVDSADSYMGQMMGGLQSAAGLLLIVLETAKTGYWTADTNSGVGNMIQTSTTAISLALASLFLVNSFLYGDGPKPAVAKPKMS